MTAAVPQPEEQQPDEQAAQDPADLYGEDFRDLPKQLVDALEAIVKDFQGAEKWARRREVRRDRTNRFYDEGYQFLSWANNTANQSGYTILTPGAWVPSPGGGNVQCPQFMDAYNVFHSYLWVIMSVLAENTPGIDFQAIDGAKEEDGQAANAAECYSSAFDRQNDVNGITRDMVRMLGLSGRCVVWTRTEEDAQKFGYEDDGTPKKFQTSEVFGTLETKVQISARKYDRNFPYCLIYRDKDICILKDDYPWLKDEIKANTPALQESMYERTARLGVLGGTRTLLSDAFSYIGTELNAFLRPSTFRHKQCENPFSDAQETDKNEDGTPFTVGDKLRQLFPEGIRATWIGDKYAAACAESMDDHIAIEHPFPGDGQFRMAFMDPAVVVQDNINDLMNWVREKFDTGAGSLWINATQEEVDAINSQKAAPNVVRPLKLGANTTSLQDNVYKEEDPQVPASMTEYLEMLQGPFLQFVLSAPPALFGESMPDQKTASGYAQAKNQATGRIGLIYGRLQAMWARIRFQSAICASKEAQEDEQIVLPGGANGQDTVVNLGDLGKGKFGCYPDEDSSYPETTAQKRAAILQLFQMAAQNPAALQLLMTPDTLKEFVRVYGWKQLVFLPAEARDKQVFEIEKLLKETPIAPSPEELQANQVAVAAQKMGGPPAPPLMPKSSVTVGPFDFDQWEGDKCDEWLSSDARREEDAKWRPMKGDDGKPIADPQLDPLCQKFGCRSYGVLNVILHRMEHQAAQQQKAPPMPPPAPKGAPAPPPGPPALPAPAPM